MQQQLGVEYPGFTAAHSTTPPVSVRWNPRQAPGLRLHAPVPWAALGGYLAERPVFAEDPLWHAGAYYVQEASSMLLEQPVLAWLAERKTPVFALDLCAAPGGKATHLASLLPPASVLVANEVVPKRAAVLMENLTKWGTPTTLITRATPAAFAPLAGQLDLVVVDAPCSGEGLWRRNPKAVQEWHADSPAVCAARQADILAQAAPLVAPGGLLLYSTCTYAPEENIAPLRPLLQQGFRPLTWAPNPDWGFQEIEIAAACFGFQAYPHRVAGEGFFLAALQRSAGLAAGGGALRAFKPVKPKALAEISPWVHLPPDWKAAQFGDTLTALPPVVAERLQHLPQNLQVLQAGVPVAQSLNRRWVPAQAAAYHPALVQQVPRVPLDQPLALQYLRGEAIPVSPAHQGWTIPDYQGWALGWGKAAAGRLNNHYPKAWRLRRA